MVVEIFEAGRKSGSWQDAEQFLSTLSSYDALLEQRVKTLFDHCRSKLGVNAEATSWVGLDDNQVFDPNEPLASTCGLESLGCDASALVAGQCMEFVEAVRSDREAWLPYDRWVQSLSNNDIIISFNYDDVVETAFARNGRLIDAPNPRWPPERRPGVPRLLKLHGGVSIRDTIPDPYEPPTVSNLKRNPAFIAIPGMSKANMAETEFDQLWDEAETALMNASHISIVGYSCPASDEMAKALLLDSLFRNAHKPAVEVVLGPDPVAAARLAALLGRAGVAVCNVALRAEDYLSASGVGSGWKPREPNDDIDDDRPLHPDER
jgi:hypothetical protein